MLITILSQLPPYDDAQLLVDVFFTFLESNWYYFDEKWFRNLLTEMYMSKTGAPQQQQCTTICLVFLVLALGSTFEHLFRPVKLPFTDRGIPGSTFFMLATKLMPRVIAVNSIESAMCCLLISLYLLATEDIPHHHIYLGLALNLAIGLSLHRMGMRNDETPQAHETKVRLFWTIYSIERYDRQRQSKQKSVELTMYLVRRLSLWDFQPCCNSRILQSPSRKSDMI